MKPGVLEEKIGYSFENKELLEIALTHSSFVRENRDGSKDNERLEFLGDAYLDAIIGKELFYRLGSKKEGDLTKLRAKIVCENSLAMLAKDINLGDAMRFGKGESKGGGKKKKSILADAVEAVLGAIVLDGGYEQAEQVVRKLFAETIEKAMEGDFFADYKSKVQEKLQVKGKITKIHYVSDKEEGPPHSKTFYVHLECDGVVMGHGVGKSKKEAEQMAAKDTLEMENEKHVF